MGLADTFESLSGGKQEYLDINTFSERWCLVPLTLAQKVILKLYAGEPLSDRVTVPHRISEIEWLKEMYQRERFPKDIYDRIDSAGDEGFKNIVLVIGRRGGKSTLVAVAALYSIYKLLMKDNPQKHYGIQEGDTISVAVAATSQDQTQKTSFGKILHICHEAIANRTPLARWIDPDGFRKKTISFKTKNDSRKEKELRKEGFKRESISSILIEAYNSNIDAFRGNAVIAGILDEFAQFGITADGRDAAAYFHQTLVASLQQFKKDARLFILSTPQGEVGKFYEVYREIWDGGATATLAIHMPTWEAWEFEKHPLITMKDLADDNNVEFSWDYENGEDFESAWMRTPAHIRREYGAEFEGAEAQWLPSILVRNNFEKESLSERPRGVMGRSYVAHADPGRTTDAFAFVICHKEVDQDMREIIIVDHAYRWYVAPHKRYQPYEGYEHVVFQEGENPAFIHTSLPMKHIKTYLSRFNVELLTFDQFQNTGYVDELSYYCQEKDIPTAIDTIHFSRNYNMERSSQFETLLLEDRLWCYPHPILKWELVNLQKDKLGRVAKSTYSTDDMYDALSAAAMSALELPASDARDIKGHQLNVDPVMPDVSM